MLALQLLLATVGVAIVVTVLLSAVRTVVIPRAESVALTRAVFSTLRKAFDVLVRVRPGWEWTDRVMSLYAPLALLALPLVWLTLVFLAFGLLFWAAGEPSLLHALEVSGSSLLTLGFTKPATPLGIALAFVGAAIVLAIVVLLLVSYLPTMYQAFAQREREVVLLESRAGNPPTGVEFIERLARIHGLGALDAVWEKWEEWFARVQESHTTHPALVFFRSQRPDQSWVTAAGALLDAASLYVSCVDLAEVLDVDRPHQPVPAPQQREESRPVRAPEAELCIRAGYLCLREIAAFFRIPVDHDPQPGDPIAVSREEFDEVWARMAARDVPLVDDREAAWRAFAGWRVNYDTALLELANLVVAPGSPWTSDRSPPLVRTAGRNGSGRHEGARDGRGPGDRGAARSEAEARR